MAHPYTASSVAMVFNLINQENGTYYNPTDVSLKNVRPDSSGVGQYNTAVDIVGNPSEGFEGTVTVYYNRINIADAFALCDVQIKWQGESDTLGVMKAVNALYGTAFDASDIELEYFNPNTLPRDITVRMRDDSYAWTGSLPVKIVPFTQSLTTGVQTVVDAVFDYPTGQSDKAQGPLYLRPYSFDSYWTVLRNISSGQQTSQVSQTLKALINGMLPSANQWVLSATPTARNLGYTNGLVNVLYAGPPKAEYTHRLGVGRILVILLSNTLCTDGDG